MVGSSATAVRGEFSRAITVLVDQTTGDQATGASEVVLSTAEIAQGLLPESGIVRIYAGGYVSDGSEPQTLVIRLRAGEDGSASDTIIYESDPLNVGDDDPWAVQAMLFYRASSTHKVGGFGYAGSSATAMTTVADALCVDRVATTFIESNEEGSTFVSVTAEFNGADETADLDYFFVVPTPAAYYTEDS